MCQLFSNDEAIDIFNRDGRLEFTKTRYTDANTRVKSITADDFFNEVTAHPDDLTDPDYKVRGMDTLSHIILVYDDATGKYMCILLGSGVEASDRRRFCSQSCAVNYAACVLYAYGLV